MNTAWTELDPATPCELALAVSGIRLANALGFAVKVAERDNQLALVIDDGTVVATITMTREGAIIGNATTFLDRISIAAEGLARQTAQSLCDLLATADWSPEPEPESPAEPEKAPQ